MIENHELYNQIPKPVQKWTSEDVKKWFSLNKIKVSSNLKIDGQNFKKLTPTKLIKQCEIQSHFLIRKITDWLQFQVSDFNEYVQQVQNQNQQNTQAKQLKDQYSQMRELSLKNEQKDQEVSKTFNKQFQTELIKQEKKKQSSKIQQELQKNEKKYNLTQQDISPIKMENQVFEVYKPMKYKASKNLKKKKQQVKNKKVQETQPEKIIWQNCLESERNLFKDDKNSKINKNMLKLNDLEQNYQNNQSNEDIPTQKHIPDSELQIQQSQWSSYFRQYKSQFIKKQQNNDIKKVQQKISPLSQNPNIKFISSQYCIPQINSLFFHFDKHIYKIHENGITKIGRSNINDIVLPKDSISRLHAQVIVEQQQEYGQKSKKYYLKDIGSKFGTFVQIDPERPKKINEGDVYCIGSTLIEVRKTNVYKNKQKFDLTVNQIFQQNKKSFIFYNKNQITVGKKLRQSTSKDSQKNNYSQLTKRLKEKMQIDTKDIQLEDANICGYHCRFVILNQQIYFEQVQGNIYQKLQKNQMKLLQRLRTLIKLGQENAIIQKENTYKMIQP